MTHTLHRKGIKNDLKEDYVLLAMLAREINDIYDDSRQKLIKIAEIMNKHNPVNILLEIGWRTSSAITATFDNIETIKEVIRELKKKDFGISIVVSGLISEIENVLQELPSKEILEITTMCGHHTVSPQSITFYVELIKQEKISIEKAAQKLTSPCVCGIVNTSRIIKILKSLVNK
ncbi:MAG: hypothetical protein ACXAEX_01380 [Promethearchaeota archaeon]